MALDIEERGLFGSSIMRFGVKMARNQVKNKLVIQEESNENLLVIQLPNKIY